MRKQTIWITTFSLILILIFTACSNKTESNQSKEDKHDAKTTVFKGDLREETINKEVLPSFLNKKPETMQNIYAAVADYQELLESMPCYCGCGDSVGHKDNYDCFIHDNKDKAVVWDDHGTRCNVCLEIAAKAINDYRDGMSAEDIRKEIDEQYKEGYAEPTPTPAV